MDRRAFLRSTAALSSAGLAGALDLFPLAARAAPTDYKALVCIFLFGGVDGNHLLVPTDTAGYGAYSAVRGPSSGIQLTQAELLPVSPIAPNTYGAFGLHPDLTELKTLFDARKLAFLANVGMLTQPTSKADYAAGRRPDNLFSHSDQQGEWQTSVATGISRTGWGGRLADATASTTQQSFPVITSTAGATLYVSGAATSPLTIPTSRKLRSLGIRQRQRRAGASRGAQQAARPRSRQHARRRGFRHHEARAVARGSGQSDPYRREPDGDGGIRRPDLTSIAAQTCWRSRR